TGQTANTVTGNTFGALSTATWYQVVITYASSSGAILLYVNNATPDSGTASFTPVVSSTGPLRIGVDASTNFWDGRVQRAGLWKKVLSASEVSQLYNSGAGL